MSIATPENTIELYLDLLKLSVTGMIQEDPAISLPWRPDGTYNKQRRYAGRDWPSRAHTMVGMDRLNNIQMCAQRIIADGIPGDFIETGVWRGGTCIFMRGLLKAYNVTDRTVFVADSFNGFPPNSSFEDDNPLIAQAEQRHLAVPLAEVIHNFDIYELLDDQVRFLPGWFEDTLPGPIEKLSILRLDGDLYKSTMDALVPLYPLLSPGGYCIVDDWNVDMCRRAVGDYRRSQGINDQLRTIDGRSIYWQKSQ